MPTSCPFENMKRKARYNEARAETLRDIMQYESCVWNAYQQYWDGLITQQELHKMVGDWANALRHTVTARVCVLEP